MPFSEDDKALIKNTIAQRSWFTKVISRISYKKTWMKGRLDTLLKEVKEIGSTDRT